jgi:hypothetical protein
MFGRVCPTIRSAAWSVARRRVRQGGRGHCVDGGSRSTKTGKHGESEDETAHGFDLCNLKWGVGASANTASPAGND